MSFSSNKLTPTGMKFAQPPSIENKSSLLSQTGMTIDTNTTKHHHHYNPPPPPSSPQSKQQQLQHLYVLPVLLLEFLALALTRAVIPTLLLDTFGDNVYFIMGCAECVRGLLAFVACPMFGKISDVIGRKACLFITVLGTCCPVCSLAIMSWNSTRGNSSKSGGWSWVSQHYGGIGSSSSTPIVENDYYNDNNLDMVVVGGTTPRQVWIFVILLALSGIFSSTFTLTFAYISDSVRKKKDRVSAYGLALATFGLSFTIGPMAGGYLARVESVDSGSSSTTMMTMETETGEESATFHDEVVLEDTNANFLHPIGLRRVFTTSLVLTILDLLYIYFILPESNSKSGWTMSPSKASKTAMMSPTRHTYQTYDDDDEEEDDHVGGGGGGHDCDSSSFISHESQSTMGEKWHNLRHEIIPNAWAPLDTLKIFSGDPFMYQVGYIAFLYYTSLWAVVSTLMLYAAKRFHLGPERLGELMSALGLCTMISEAVLVRIVVPNIGEKRSIRWGLIAFGLQCVVLGFAYEGWQLFICVLLSIGGNLVYPSLTSLVSSSVHPDMVGEALGAVNGVKALTGTFFF